MNIAKYCSKFRNIQSSLLEFLGEDKSKDDDEANFEKLKSIITEYNIFKDTSEINLFLHLLSKISQNCYHDANFFNKVMRILREYLNDIKKNLTDLEIFSIFIDCKRILLFLFDEKIININESMVKKITTKKYLQKKYPQYFLPEIKPFKDEKWFPQTELISYLTSDLPKNFFELRKIGENEKCICELIRNDSIEDFIVCVAKNNYSLKSTIDLSIYETNSFLIKNQIDSHKKVTLIEYAAFFGSIQIFEYLLKDAELTSRIWLFAIHGKNAEIIQHLEVYNFESIENDFNENCVKESIKCHHINITKYFLDNYIKKDKDVPSKFITQSIKVYNFLFIRDKLINENVFYDLCKYNYYSLIKMLLIDGNIDVNKKILR